MDVQVVVGRVGEDVARELAVREAAAGTAVRGRDEPTDDRAGLAGARLVDVRGGGRLDAGDLQRVADATRRDLDVERPDATTVLVTGILLGLARIMGETAPLLILGPYTANLATNLFGGFMATLPTMINTNRVESLQPAIDRTWASALTLIFVILLLNLAGRLVARTSKVKN